jgi:hypothetical protein
MPGRYGSVLCYRGYFFTGKKPCFLSDRAVLGWTLLYMHDRGGFTVLRRFVETSRNHGHPYLVTEGVIDHRTKDDVGIGVN